MIYIENNLEKQDVFIPRNDGSTCYVSPYDKGYQDGYQDGIEDCGDCPIQQKEVVLTATTETISPDQGYAGMDSVFVDARQLALEKYNEGYHEGEENGAEEQKSKLETATFDRNGEYTREDGWSAVTVDVPKDINLGTLVDAPQMSDITYEYYIKTFDPQEASVDGWGEIRLYMGTLIGESKNEQKALMTATTFTQNGFYRREDGWNEVEVAVEQTGTTCNLESKTETVTGDTQTILPSSGYDGMSEVVVDATGYGQDKYDEGHDEGYDEGYADGQASCPPCPEIESGVTYGIGSGFTGATVTPSSGYDGMAEVTITDNGYGQEKYNEGFTDGQTDILSGLTDTTIRQNGSYSNPSGWSGVTVLVQPTLEAASYALPTGFTGTTIVPSSGYDGLSSVVITDGGYGQEKYDEGYQDGLGDCPAPNLEQKSVTLTATTECFTPSSGYDGFSEVCVDATDIYNQGYNDGVEYGRDLSNYLTLEAFENGTIGFKYAQSSAYTGTPLFISYSINGGNWVSIQAVSSSSPNQITVVSGDVVTFKSTNTSFRDIYIVSGISQHISNYFTTDCNCYLYGNVMSLLYGDDFANKSTVGKLALSRVFANNSKIHNHSNKKLLLPATTLGETCYSGMFLGCTALTTAPALPATTLAEWCYYLMFGGCTSLVNAPELPALRLAESCYESMFDGCTSLVNAPMLRATSLAGRCYYSMFGLCSGLTTAPALPATNLEFGCYIIMFHDCTSLVNAPALPATTLKNNCYAGMFEDCTSLVNAPELPARVLKHACYSGMFDGCTNLSYIKCLATSIESGATNTTQDWVGGVAANGTFVKAANASFWTTGIDGIPSGWAVQDNQ